MTDRGESQGQQPALPTTASSTGREPIDFQFQRLDQAVRNFLTALSREEELLAQLLIPLTRLGEGVNVGRPRQNRMCHGCASSGRCGRRLESARVDTLKTLFPHDGMLYESGIPILESEADERKFRDVFESMETHSFPPGVARVDSKLARIFRDAKELVLHLDPRDNFPSVTVFLHEQPLPARPWSIPAWQRELPDHIVQTVMSKLVQARYRAIEQSKNIQHDFSGEGNAVKIIDDFLGDQPRKRPTLHFADYTLSRELGMTRPPRQMGCFDSVYQDRPRRAGPPRATVWRSTVGEPVQNHRWWDSDDYSQSEEEDADCKDWRWTGGVEQG